MHWKWQKIKNRLLTGACRIGALSKQKESRRDIQVFIGSVRWHRFSVIHDVVNHKSWEKFYACDQISFVSLTTFHWERCNLICMWI